MPAILNSIGFDSSSSRLVIGGDPSATNSFDGLLDDLRIWNRPLSTGEVSLLYGNGLGDFGPQGVIQVTSPNYRDQIEAVLSFNQSINDLDLGSDITTTGLTLQSSSSEDNQTYNLIFTPDSYTLRPTIDSGKCKCGDRYIWVNQS